MAKEGLGWVGHECWTPPCGFSQHVCLSCGAGVGASKPPQRAHNTERWQRTAARRQLRGQRRQRWGRGTCSNGHPGDASVARAQKKKPSGVARTGQVLAGSGHWTPPALKSSGRPTGGAGAPSTSAARRANTARRRDEFPRWLGMLVSCGELRPFEPSGCCRRRKRPPPGPSHRGGNSSRHSSACAAQVDPLSPAWLQVGPLGRLAVEL